MPKTKKTQNTPKLAASSRQKSRIAPSSKISLSSFKINKWFAIVLTVLVIAVGILFIQMSRAYSTSGRDKILFVAQSQVGHQEWDASVLDYTGGTRDAWCAYFVSWVYKQAGYPLRFDNNGRVPLAWKPGVSVRSVFQSKNKFWPAQGSGGYQAKPGDAVVFGEDRSHVGIVLKYKWDKNGFYLKTIEGNTNITLNKNPGSGTDRVLIREYTDPAVADIMGFGEAEVFIPCNQGGYKC
ncbi:MAG: CHAP domain-containing protein [bacterium]